VAPARSPGRASPPGHHAAGDPVARPAQVGRARAAGGPLVDRAVPLAALAAGLRDEAHGPDLDSALEWGRRTALATTLPIEVRPFQGETED